MIITKIFATLLLALLCFATSWAQKIIVWEKLFDQQGNLLNINADPHDLDVLEDLLKRILGNS